MSWTLDSVVWTSIIIYSLTMLYSIFMGYIGYRQAKVLGEVQKTNELLEKIHQRQLVMLEYLAVPRQKKR
jgi:hypothetical protein